MSYMTCTCTMYGTCILLKDTLRSAMTMTQTHTLLIRNTRENPVSIHHNTPHETYSSSIYPVIWFLYPECNITIHINSTNPEGVLSSPSFPGSYDKLPEGYTCWLKLVPDDPTRHLQITFEDFHLSGSLMTSCDSGEMDTLTVSWNRSICQTFWFIKHV